MARFVLIDHSVTSPGGHNFEHANDVLLAAEESGYEPVLAANRTVVQGGEFPGSWRVLPLFPDGWHDTHWIGPDGRSHHPVDIEGDLLPQLPGDARPHGLLPRVAHVCTRFRDSMRRRDRRGYINRFAEACTVLWESVRPCAEDRIFLPSVTEFDLLGLVRFLSSEPESRRVDWHLLFHFNLFAGRTPSYAGQTLTRDRFRRQFAAALAHVPDHRLHFYGITDLIAQQYNRLETAAFSEMPYTINGSIRVNAETRQQRPLRMACPGVIRREKGKRQIKPLVRRLWKDHLATGETQLFFQGRSKDLRRFFPKETFGYSTFVETPGTPAEAPIVVVRHPLAATDYAQLIRDAHIGMFLHDSERYFARCSGTLVELLGAGVPVIVPAGCWLAEQIAEPIYRHLDQVLTSDAVIESRNAQDMSWSWPAGADRPAGGFCCGGKKNPAVCETTIHQDGVNVVCSFTTAADAEPGHFVRVEASQFDSSKKPVDLPQVSIINAHRQGNRISTLFSLLPEAVTLRLTLNNAYGNERLVTDDLQVTFLGRSDQHAGGLPGGQVGLIAADLSEVSRLLRDMTDHYPHYRRTAVEFSRVWSRDHSAHAVLEQIHAASQVSAASRTRDAA